MKLKFVLLITSIFYSIIATAQSNTYKNEAGFCTDNDGFLGRGSDRYYTAGNFFYYRHALKVNDSTALKNKIIGFELGQKIFTPQSAYIPGPQYIDRPFAGYLYLGAALNLLYKNESNLKLQAQVGFVGPNSFGEQTQDVIHSTFNFYTPGGWQYQIGNDFEVNLSAQFNYLINRTNISDISLNSFADLGNGLTGAGGGFTMRLGKFNPLYNSITTTSNISANKNAGSNKNELFFYAKPQINFIAYNATIQGSIFESTPAIGEIEGTKKPVIISEQLGGSLVTGHWIVDLSAIYETSETNEMVNNGHQWGSLILMYRF